MFSTALDVDAEEDRKYEEVTMEQLLNAALLILEEYNATHKKKMNIVLFKYVNWFVIEILHIKWRLFNDWIQYYLILSNILI